MHSVASRDVDNATNKRSNDYKLNTDVKSSKENGNWRQKLDENEAIESLQLHNGSANGGRRDSTQVWTPLLENGSKQSANNDVVTPSIDVVADDTNTVLYAGTVSNNNDWKDNGKINKSKVSNLHQGNNNGSLINGKNGNGITEKYDEHDPLTGLYKQKQGLYESELDSDTQEDASQTHGCGLFGCRPKWARSLASTHVFMVVFLLAYILQGMYMTYFVSVITTIEKLFQIKSKTTGLLLSASEMGQISTAMLLTYFAGRGHRPRWIACGMVLFSIAAFACALPHFIFGEQLIHSTAFLSNKNNAGELERDQMLESALTSQVNLSMLNSSTQPESLLLAGMPRLDMNLCLVDNNPQNSSSGK